MIVPAERTHAHVSDYDQAAFTEGFRSGRDLCFQRNDGHPLIDTELTDLIIRHLPKHLSSEQGNVWRCGFLCGSVMTWYHTRLISDDVPQTHETAQVCALHVSGEDTRYAFGALLQALRRMAGPKVKQGELLHYLPSHWSQDYYSRLELGAQPPRFEDIAQLYAAFQSVGVLFSPLLCFQFTHLARKRLAMQKTYKDHHTDEEWQVLYQALVHSGAGVQ